MLFCKCGPRRTLRDGSLCDPCPGTSCQATIVESLRDAVATLKMFKLQPSLFGRLDTHKKMAKLDGTLRLLLDEAGVYLAIFFGRFLDDIWREPGRWGCFIPIE